MTTTLQGLTEGLQEIENDLLQVVRDPTASRGRVLASGFLVGYIIEVLPQLARVTEADSIRLEAETDQLLAALRNAREKNHG